MSEECPGGLRYFITTCPLTGTMNSRNTVFLFKWRWQRFKTQTCCMMSNCSERLCLHLEMISANWTCVGLRKYSAVRSCSLGHILLLDKRKQVSRYLYTPRLIWISQQVDFSSTTNFPRTFKWLDVKTRSSTRWRFMGVITYALSEHLFFFSVRVHVTNVIIDAHNNSNSDWRS